jgi:type II secretory pathway pseudopilin PulG
MNSTMRKPKSIRQAAFSMFEMLVVVGIIGIMGAVVFPAIGRVSESAKDSAARGTGDVVVVLLNAAATCGFSFSTAMGWDGSTPGNDIVQAAVDGVTIPASVGGTFAGKKFSTGEIAADERARFADKLVYDPVNNRIKFTW